MNVRTAALLMLVNGLLSAACVATYALWFSPGRAQQIAVLDVGELYRLKETQVAALLVKRDTNDADRALALQRASTFGLEVTSLIQSLPKECRCFILARGAVVGPAPHLPDLTPEVRQRLGL